jgi:hypothetical protein
VDIRPGPSTTTRSTASQHQIFLSQHRINVGFNPSRGLHGPPESRVYRVRSNHPLEPAMATDWSITHSPTPRYLSTHFDTSLFSPATLSVLKLGLERSPKAGGNGQP